MALKKLLDERYSVRTFADTAVPAEKLQAILEAGRLAPTACNNQPQKIYVLQSEEALQKIRSCTTCHFNAPVVLLVCYDKDKSWNRSFDGFNSGEMDASIVSSYMTLAIAEQGLGSTWVCYFDPEKIKKEFNLPQNLVPAALFPLGFPTELCKANRKARERKKLDETVTYL